MLKQQPSPAVLITVSSETLAGARRSIHACESCSNNAHVSFSQLLDRFTGFFHSDREYVLTEDLLCPWCMSPIDNDTLLELHCGRGRAAAACARSVHSKLGNLQAPIADLEYR
jgi:hypothetical protein